MRSLYSRPCLNQFSFAVERQRPGFPWPVVLAVLLHLNTVSLTADDSSAATSAAAQTGAPATAAAVENSKSGSEAGGRVIHLEKLETKDGKVYTQVTVRKTEPDSLLIEHSNGLASISLFDVSEEIQERYHFDHEAAIEAYKRREAEQRAVRRKLFHDRIRQQAAEEAEKRQENLERRAKMEWLPVRAKILTVRDGGALAIVDRIVMRPTRTINAFGNEGLPGPPKKEFVRLSPSPVWLKTIGDIETPSDNGPPVYWNGYIWPDGTVSLNARNPENTTAAYRTLKTKE